MRAAGRKPSPGVPPHPYLHTISAHPKKFPSRHSPPHCPLPPNDPSQLLTITLTSQETHHTHAASQPLSPHGLRCASPFEATGHSIMPPPHAAARRRTHSYPTLHRLASPHHMRAHPRLPPPTSRCAGGRPVRPPHARRRGPAQHAEEREVPLAGQVAARAPGLL